MDKMKVNQLMRSIVEFFSIPGDASFLEALDALEAADREYNSGKTPERILLVHKKPGKITGKISPMDIVQGLEPNYRTIENMKSHSYYGIVRSSLEEMKKNFRLWYSPLGELWRKANKIKIRDFIKMPSEDQIVDANDNIDTAFHLFVMTRHGSLFVMKDARIIGLILFSDVYKKIKEAMRTAPPSAN